MIGRLNYVAIAVPAAIGTPTDAQAQPSSSFRA
jgi:hypothetical protein